jgi:hypothetical protein
MNDLPSMPAGTARSALPARPLDPALVAEVCADAIAGSSSSGNLNSVSIVLC